MKLTFLGTGGSLGVPVIGCDCPVCASDDPHNRRYRPAALLEFDGRQILIDTPPEFRLQALRHGIERLDAVLYTHAHADHILGLDDLRIIGERMQACIPVFGSPETLASLKHMFGYAFVQKIWRTDIPLLEAHPVRGMFDLFGLEVIPVPVQHAEMEVLGFRFGPFAYVTDVSHIPGPSMSLLEDLDLLVISALRPRPHMKHFSVDQAVEVVRRLKPSRTFFTHISHELEHETLKRYLPAGIEPAWDGLVVES